MQMFVCFLFWVLLQVPSDRLVAIPGNKSDSPCGTLSLVTGYDLTTVAGG